MKKAHAYKFDTDTSEFGKLMLSAVRYGAGRMTYVPECIETYATDNSCIIVDPWRTEIITHVESLSSECAAGRQEYEKNVSAAGGTYEWLDAGGKCYHGALGMDFDEDGWLRFLRTFEGSDADEAMLPADGVPTRCEASFQTVGDFWLFVSCAMRHDVDTGHAYDDDEHAGMPTYLSICKGLSHDMDMRWNVNMLRNVWSEMACSQSPCHDDAYICEGWEPLAAFLNENIAALADSDGTMKAPEL